MCRFKYQYLGISLIVIIFSILVIVYRRYRRYGGDDQLESFVSKCGIQRYYMINLEDATDRWNTSQLQLRPYNIKLERYLAVDTRSYANVRKYRGMISDEANSKLDILQHVKRRHKHRDLSNGAVGCYLSHMGIYQKMIDEQVQLAMIMEDDIDINAAEVAKMDQVCDRLPANWDIVLLGCINRDRPPYPIINGFQRVDWFWGLHCYLIHIDAARRLLAKLLPIQYQIDYVISQMSVERELQVYRTMPEIVIQNRTYKTQIQIPLLSNDPKYIQRNTAV